MATTTLRLQSPSATGTIHFKHTKPKTCNASSADSATTRRTQVLITFDILIYTHSFD